MAAPPAAATRTQMQGGRATLEEQIVKARELVLALAPIASRAFTNGSKV
jgi:hypothetical protein